MVLNRYNLILKLCVGHPESSTHLRIELVQGCDCCTAKVACLQSFFGLGHSKLHVSAVRFTIVAHVCEIAILKQIYRRIKVVYCEEMIGELLVRKWLQKFNAGRSDVWNDKRSGEPSLITEDLTKCVDFIR